MRENFRRKFAPKHEPSDVFRGKLERPPFQAQVSQWKLTVNQSVETNKAQPKMLYSKLAKPVCIDWPLGEPSSGH